MKYLDTVQEGEKSKKSFVLSSTSRGGCVRCVDLHFQRSDLDAGSAAGAPHRSGNYEVDVI